VHFSPDILSQRLRKSVKGEILLDGETPTSSFFQQNCGYVKQDDLLFPSLTVRETIAFSAHLRLPSSFSAADRESFIDKTISELDLGLVANQLIGGDLIRGISGGEKKRVSIAVELVRQSSKYNLAANWN
jgi:ABC-type multidrug transport system ATPase subunit